MVMLRQPNKRNTRTNKHCCSAVCARRNETARAGDVPTAINRHLLGTLQKQVKNKEATYSYKGFWRSYQGDDEGVGDRSQEM